MEGHRVRRAASGGGSFTAASCIPVIAVATLLTGVVSMSFPACPVQSGAGNVLPSCVKSSLRSPGPSTRHATVSLGDSVCAEIREFCPVHLRDDFDEETLKTWNRKKWLGQLAVSQTQTGKCSAWKMDPARDDLWKRGHLSHGCPSPDACIKSSYCIAMRNARELAEQMGYRDCPIGQPWPSHNRTVYIPKYNHLDPESVIHIEDLPVRGEQPTGLPPGETSSQVCDHEVSTTDPGSAVESETVEDFDAEFGTGAPGQTERAPWLSSPAPAQSNDEDDVASPEPARRGRRRRARRRRPVRKAAPVDDDQPEDVDLIILRSDGKSSDNIVDHDRNDRGLIPSDQSGGEIGSPEQYADDDANFTPDMYWDGYEDAEFDPNCNADDYSPYSPVDNDSIFGHNDTASGADSLALSPDGSSTLSVGEALAEVIELPGAASAQAPLSWGKPKKGSAKRLRKKLREEAMRVRRLPAQIASPDVSSCESDMSDIAVPAPDVGPIIFDSGSAKHLLKECLTVPYQEFVEQVDNPIYLSTASGPAECCKAFTYYSPVIDEKITHALMLPDTPTVWSMGYFVMDKGWHFEWPPRSHAPFAIKPDGTIVYFIVRDLSLIHI